MKKTVGVVSGTVVEEQFEFGGTKKYQRIILGSENVLEINEKVRLEA